MVKTTIIMATTTTTTVAMARPAADIEPFDYLRDPDAIYRRSFEMIERETNFDQLPIDLHPLARRIVHACGMPDIVTDLAWSGKPAQAGRRALAKGATILCDTNMVAAGLIRSKFPADTQIVCELDAPEAKNLASRLLTTRSAAAVELWQHRLRDAIVVIGNAPTALFHLLERLAVWQERPALIFAFPVGFVGAAESKDALITNCRGIPFLTLRGRRGGSAMAAAAVNALLINQP